MSPSADLVPNRSEERQDQPNDQDDGPNSPKELDLAQNAGY
jgi:hypothetical protein